MFSLRQMLREDVVGSLEGLLASAAKQPDAERRAELYYEGVCSALAACKRLTDPADDVVASAPASSEPGNAAQADALELERLRRDLAETKVALAEASNARDLAEHELLLERQRRKSRSRFASR